MKASSANILRENKREIRAIGSACDPACAMWAFCQNSVTDGLCKGFFLLNGKSQNLLNKTLNEDDKIYVENVTRMAQNESSEETRENLVREVLRFIPREESEPTQRPEGFSYMAKCARGVQNTPTQEPDPVERAQPNRGFTGMIESAFSHEPTERTVTRAVDPSLFPDICDGKSCPSEYQRHCSANRVEHYGERCVYKTLTTEELKTHSETRAIDNNKLKNLLDRLEIVEKELRNAENSPKNDHILPNRPNFCKPKSLDGVDEE